MDIRSKEGPPFIPHLFAKEVNSLHERDSYFPRFCMHFICEVGGQGDIFACLCSHFFFVLVAMQLRGEVAPVGKEGRKGDLRGKGSIVGIGGRCVIVALIFIHDDDERLVGFAEGLRG